MNTTIDKKIFVIGSGRCGTTWMGRWLQRHPQTFGGHETHLFKIVGQVLNKDWAQGLKTWSDHHVIIDAIRSFADATLGQYKYRQEEQIHLVEHSPIHCSTIDLIQEVYPDALFVYLYRDGRNVVESWLRSTESNNAYEFIDRWVTTIKDIRNRVNDPNIFQIKYEHLMKNPRESRKITEFLGLSHHFDIDSWEFPVNTPFFDYDPNRWQRLPSDVKQSFEDGEMKELLSDLGYV